MYRSYSLVGRHETVLGELALHCGRFGCLVDDGELLEGSVHGNVERGVDLCGAAELARPYTYATDLHVAASMPPRRTPTYPNLKGGTQTSNTGKLSNVILPAPPKVVMASNS